MMSQWVEIIFDDVFLISFVDFCFLLRDLFRKIPCERLLSGEISLKRYLSRDFKCPNVRWLWVEIHVIKIRILLQKLFQPIVLMQSL